MSFYAVFVILTVSAVVVVVSNWLLINKYLLTAASELADNQRILTLTDCFHTFDETLNSVARLGIAHAVVLPIVMVLFVVVYFRHVPYLTLS